MLSVFLEFVRVRTARKKPSQGISCVESLPTEYSYSQGPSVSHENTTSESSLERSLHVCVDYILTSAKQGVFTFV